VDNDDSGAIARIDDGLAGRTHLVEVCRWVCAHRGRLSIDERDPLLIAIVGITSETDDFDVSEAQRALWNPDALAAKDRELDAYVRACDLRGTLEALRARLAGEGG
jgi:hypothetical protein